MVVVKKAKPCIEPDCGRRKWLPRQRCYFHALMHLPIEEQEAQARKRRESAQEIRARVPKKEWPAGTRWCAGCQWFVPTFYARGSRCRACASMAGHRRAVADTYQWAPGVTYDKLLALQGGRCAICRCTPQTRRLAVDHDHLTGQTRGLLCQVCNHELLGAAHDDVRVLRNAVYYLENWPSRAVR